MPISASDLKNDIDELQALRKQAKRSNVQLFLDELLKKWLANLDELNRRDLITSDAPKTIGVAARPYKKLTTYGFDESDKFVKIYYSIPGISSTPVTAIKEKFNENSFDIFCTDVNGTDYEINVRGLSKAVDPDKCYFKQKSGDQLLVMLKKVRENENWGSLLKIDKKEQKTPKFDKDEDPQASLMNMMKQMYDEGDDEMKRTIRKSWYEAQNKKATSEMDF
uniref:Calcyclin-binding protein n=1 Tax=Meloidogyne incognita TaxID=6306 RepID=A0A914L1F4_MELIC